MSSFTHYLVTRYNVPIQGWDTDKAGRMTKDKAWLDHRLQLFCNYCLSTVLGQEEKRFIWLIYFDVQTPAPYLQAIEQKLGSLKYQIRLVNDFKECIDDLKNIISASSTPFAISSRLDNDDGIGKFYIQDVQQMFAEEHQTLIILEGGVVYDATKKILSRILHHNSNHYGSLIEKCTPKNNLITILGFAHDTKHNFKTTLVNKPNSWLKIIHDRNLNSRMYGMPTHPGSVIQFYTLHKDHLTVSVLNTLAYFFSRAFKRVQHQLLRNK